MSSIVLGLDIGGANLKAATVGNRAVSVPFALWKQPDRLPAVLAELTSQFPDATEFAVTMTGELCDCYETKRQGVNAILDAVEFAAAGKPVRVWSVAGEFLSVAESRERTLQVAASNWHALATFAGRFVPKGTGLILDIGSTTTDLILLHDGKPEPRGFADFDRLRSGELVYLGVRRTPVCAIETHRVMAELFATTEDVFLVLGELPENPADRDTADNRPATREFALARLARMLGGDRETLTDDEIVRFAERVKRVMISRILQFEFLSGGRQPPEGASTRGADAPRSGFIQTAIVSGSGEFFAREVISHRSIPRVVSLNAELGPDVSECAPAYALAVLATEGRT